MSIHRRRRIDRETAERLLSGLPSDRRGDDPLADLLASLTGPPRPSEYVGEESALYAFREARLGPAPSPRRQPMRRTVLARLLTVKMAALVGALAVSSYALAAGAGIVPNPLDTKPGAAPTSTQATGRPAPGLSSSRPGSLATPSPSLVGLCRAYGELADNERGQALDTPAFAALLTAAGAKDRVATYCDGVLASPTPPVPSVPPSAASHPTGPPSEHPTGPPTEIPSGPAKKQAPR